MARTNQMRILCPNGHLGFAPTKEESFWLGVETSQISIAVIRAVTISDPVH